MNKNLYNKLLNKINEAVKVALSNHNFDNEISLNEYNKFENADHHRGGNFPDIKYLSQVLSNEYGYKAYPVSPTTGNPYQLIIRREDNVRRNVYVQQRKKTTKTGNIALQLKYYGDSISLLDIPEIDEFCFISPPLYDYEAHNGIVSNTKACFFDKEYIKNLVDNGKIPITQNKNGEVLLLKERWLKENAKQVISYKYIK